MENNKTINMRVMDAITLCQLIDEYGIFHEGFMDLLRTEKNKSKVMVELSKMSRNERRVASRRVKNFYNTYKTIIDTIEQNTGIQSFSFYNYDYKYGSSEVVFKSDAFYQYLLANVSQKNKILSVLERLKVLGFEEFDLNQIWDFSKEVYKATITYCEQNRVVYLDNLESIPKYEHGIVTYKTNGSNYKIELIVSSFSHLVYRDRIRLNSLIFDVDRLPKELSGKNICNEIIGLTSKKSQEYTAIRNSVNLSVGIQDLEYLLNRFNENVTKMESVDSKEQVLEELRNMQQSLSQIQTLSSIYNQSITANGSYITPQLLQEQVKQYLIRREESKIH